MLLTTTEPLRGRTFDDGLEIPALFKFYEATKGKFLRFSELIK